MSLITLGLNHKTTPLELRERLAFTPQNLREALNSLIKVNGVTEAAILSTCNRTELYCALHSDKITDAEPHTGDDQRLIDWFSGFHGLESSALESHIYIHDHKQSIRHAMEVASGLDSMVLGEPQITGQMKQAYVIASHEGTVGQLLGKLFQHSFSVAKQVRTDTAIGSSPVSVAFAATSLARQIFGELDHSTALMIGAGETIELAARHLQSQNIKKIIVANRSLERAQNLAEEFDGEAINLQHIGDHLHRADIVIASTASPLPVLGKGTVERALKKRKHAPIFMVDLAVPRDIEPEVNSLDDVYLYSVDDLQEVISENLQNRQQAAEQAHEIIDEKVEHYLDWQRSLVAVDVISELRSTAMQFSDDVLKKSIKQLSTGQDPEDVLVFLAHTLTNKFLHQPSTELRKAGEEERHELIQAARRLFIDKSSDKPNN
ncbi:MAG: glutamyl-tRNA reductase [Gammaproteobacteria bacterium]|nr:glutamyl-tRNA reductase [Gammaproteobacteria bacterium]